MRMLGRVLCVGGMSGEALFPASLVVAFHWRSPAVGRSLGRGLEKRGEGEREGLKEATEEPRGERPPSDSPPPSTLLGTKGRGRRKGRAGENWGASAGGRQEA